jgi:hypothetical protein
MQNDSFEGNEPREHRHEVEVGAVVEHLEELINSPPHLVTDRSVFKVQSAWEFFSKLFILVCLASSFDSEFGIVKNASPFISIAVIISSLRYLSFENDFDVTSIVFVFSLVITPFSVGFFRPVVLHGSSTV